MPSKPSPMRPGGALNVSRSTASPRKNPGQPDLGGQSHAMKLGSTVSMALLASLSLLLVRAATAAGRLGVFLVLRRGGLRAGVLVALLAGLNVLFVGSTLVGHDFLLVIEAANQPREQKLAL